jgi:hypothetical protein
MCIFQLLLQPFLRSCYRKKKTICMCECKHIYVAWNSKSWQQSPYFFQLFDAPPPRESKERQGIEGPASAVRVCLLAAIHPLSRGPSWGLLLPRHFILLFWYSLFFLTQCKHCVHTHLSLLWKCTHSSLHLQAHPRDCPQISCEVTWHIHDVQSNCIKCAGTFVLSSSTS